MTRRQLLAAALAARPAAPVVDTHIHLFDPERVPYHPRATYRPPAAPLEPYAAFVRDAGITHTVIVHPEPYQNDHRYLEYCFAHEPSPGFFKGTCLLDPVAPDTPARLGDLVRRHPRRIVALRIHAMHAPGTPPLASGPIKDRDLASPAMRTTWAAAEKQGIAIQMHFLPYYAPQIEDLARRFPALPVILDHLARAGQGTPQEFAGVLRLARLPRVYMKYSAINYSSKQPYPHADAKPLVRQAFDAFGPDRIVWGGLGHNRAEFDRQQHLFDEMFAFATPADRDRIRGGTAMRLFAF